MKYIVFSDSHGVLKYMEQALDKERFDGIIFCGDGYSDAETIEKFYPGKAFIKVTGNCDFRFGVAAETVCRTDGVTFVVCHGHTYGVKDSLYALRRHARECGAGAVLYGHTHMQHLDTDEDGLVILNPGSIACGDYALITFKDGKVRAELKEI